MEFTLIRYLKTNKGKTFRFKKKVNLAAIIGQSKESNQIIESWKNRLVQTLVEAL